jgi:hypothetical protein
VRELDNRPALSVDPSLRLIFGFDRVFSVAVISSRGRAKKFLTLIFYGVAITLSTIIRRTIFVYKIFFGKVSGLSYE